MLGVSRPSYVNVDSPNLGFPYFNFLGGYQWKNTLYVARCSQSNIIEGEFSIGAVHRPNSAQYVTFVQIRCTILFNVIFLCQSWSIFEDEKDEFRDQADTQAFGFIFFLSLISTLISDSSFTSETEPAPLTSWPPCSTASLLVREDLLKIRSFSLNLLFLLVCSPSSLNPRYSS